MVYPYLSYGITLWGFTYDIHLNKHKIQQNKIIRSIAGAHYQVHSEPIFKSLKLLQLSDIYKLQISKFAFFFVNKTLPSSLSG